MPNHVKKLSLATDEKEFLMQLLRQSTLEARKYLRAKILLSKDRGLSNEKIAEKLEITVPTVRLCIEKYENGGVENALEDIKGRGRKKEISDSDETWVINKACQKPVDLGLSAEMWCPASFTRYLNSVAVKEGHPRLEHVSEYTVRKILAKAKIQPFKVKYYCEKRDPNFDSKMHDVLVIYKQLELQFNDDGTVNASDDEDVVHTLSYDEKPGIQAIESTTADLPPIAGTDKTSTIMRDYEYIRHGTLSLLAAIDLLTGEAIPLVSSTHKSSDFIHFLKLLDEKYPKKDKIRIILDNHSAHTSKETQEYLNTTPNRFQFVFTPTHGSWLNMIEGFFSKMTKQMLKGIRVDGTEELKRRIYLYFEEINKVPVPYHWTYKLDDINIEKEDISKIVYEVVNRKAVKIEDQEKRAPEPIKRTRKKKESGLMEA